jgi:hypothetical protein
VKHWGRAHVCLIKALAALLQPALPHHNVGRNFCLEFVGEDFDLPIQAFIFSFHEIDLSAREK